MTVAAGARWTTEHSFCTSLSCRRHALKTPNSWSDRAQQALSDQLGLQSHGPTARRQSVPNAGSDANETFRQILATPAGTPPGQRRRTPSHQCRRACCHINYYGRCEYGLALISSMCGFGFVKGHVVIDDTTDETVTTHATGAHLSLSHHPLDTLSAAQSAAVVGSRSSRHPAPRFL